MEVIGEAAYQAVQKQIEAALSGQEVVYEREMYYQGVQPRFVHSTFVPDRGEQGEVKGFVAVVNDITEKKRQQDALIESERRYRFMAECIPQIVWTANPDGGLDYYNQRWTDYTGLTLEQTTDWGWRECPHPDDLQATIDAWAEALRTGGLYFIEHRIRGKEGAYRWFLTRAVPMCDVDGNIVKWFGTATDIDEQKQAEMEIAALNARLWRSVQETHHRVKNNLQIISALAELQTEEGEDTVPVTAMKRIGQHTRSLAALHDLLTQEAKSNVETDSISTKAALDKLVPLLASHHRRTTHPLPGRGFPSSCAGRSFTGFVGVGTGEQRR